MSDRAQLYALARMSACPHGWEPPCIICPGSGGHICALDAGHLGCCRCGCGERPPDAEHMAACDCELCRFP